MLNYFSLLAYFGQLIKKSIVLVVSREKSANKELGSLLTSYIRNRHKRGTLTIFM